MSDATDINSLPLNPMAGGSMEPNIIMHKNEVIENKLENIAQARDTELRQMMMNQGQPQGPQGQNSQLQSQNVSLDQNLINKLISGIQQASMTGQTELPSRDIPQMTSQYTQDSQIKPNYIPNQERTDYINNDMTSDDIIIQNTRKYNKSDSLDVIYDELQMPILIGILFFIFQLPFFRKHLMKFLPSIFNNDGNYTLKGLMVTSSLFASSFYTLKKILNYLMEMT
jgi:hypothetical protein